MKATEVLNKIKTEIRMQVNIETAKLADGVTVIEAETFAPENEVFIVMDEDRVPLAPGEYEMEDGRKLVVEIEGIIAQIGEQAEDVVAEEEEEKEEDLKKDDKPKTIVETKVKETYFEEETPAEVVETVEAVEDEVLGEVSAIIEDLTPETVTEADASEMAVAVVEAVTETLEDMPEELKEKYMRKRKKYGKNKLTEDEASVIQDAEAEIVSAVAEVVNAETPEEVTPEIAETIAEVVTEAVQEIVAEAPEELKKQVFKKTKLSKVKSKNKKRIDLAKEKIEKLHKLNATKKAKTTAKPLRHNTEKKTAKKVDFQIANKRPKNTLDRVMEKLYK